MTTLIVGGGIAGAASAALLGRDALLVEREAGPHHKVCGEFVSWEAEAMLSRLGLDLATLGAARIDAVRLVHGQRMVEHALPGTGFGLSRHRLDAALLNLAAAHGAQVERGRSVRRLIQGTAATQGAEVEGMGTIQARRVFLATGKHELRGMQRDHAAEKLLGFKMHYRLTAEQTGALAGRVEIVLFPGGYAGLQPIEGGAANLCLLMARDLASSWEAALTHLLRTSPHLAMRLEAAEQLLPRPAAIARVPYGHVHRGDDAVFRLGDQAGVIPSFCGDGMAIALHTAFAATKARDAAEYHRRMRAELSGQIGRAMTLHRLGQTAPGLVMAAARAWPGALAWVARLTRIRPREAPEAGVMA